MTTRSYPPSDQVSQTADRQGADAAERDVDEVSVREFLMAGGRHGLTTEEMFRR